MNELMIPSIVEEKEKIELAHKKQQEIKHTLLGKLAPKKGHFIWEIREEIIDKNNVIIHIDKAQYTNQTIVFNKAGKLPRKQLIVNKDCVYIPALNKKNALIKYNKNLTQSYYYKTITDMKFVRVVNKRKPISTF